MLTRPGIAESTRRWFATLALLIACGSPLAPASAGVDSGPSAQSPAPASTVGAAQQVQWTNIDRVVAFADVHGAYAELVALLQSVGVVDGDLRWSAGRTHVVSLGDLLDRGDDSRKVMDLLMRLQQEAAAAGGQLHVVVGNHEAMNVLGDLRYVSRGDYAAYVGDEDEAIRDEQRKQYLVRNPGSSDADFDRTFPPGYFGQRKLLGPDGKYGRWILAQPAIIVVNDTVYMHGGPSRALGGRRIAQLDRDYDAAVTDYLAAESALRDAGLLEPEDAYGRRPDLAQARLGAMPAGERRSALAPLVAQFARADENPLLGPDGPNWYRGAALCNECAEADVLKPFLTAAGARRVVVGHTVARNGTAVARFDGALIKLDAGMNKAVYHGRPAALILDSSGIRVAYANPTVPPADVPRETLYLSSPTMDENTVAAVLAAGSIEPTETCGPGILRVRVTQEGKSVDAVFEAAPAQTVGHELAAWRLDQLLGLGLVPATVARTYGGATGVLQGRPASWATEQDRQNLANGTRAGLACQVISNDPRVQPLRRPPATAAVPARLPSGGYCDIKAQYQLAYAFDALIGNQARTFDRYLYDLDPSMQARGLSLILSGHGSAFGSQVQLPSAIQGPLASTGPEMQSRLRKLDAASVKAAIGQWVSDAEIKALMARRDRILEITRTPAAN
ncbi:MAG: metallophosphoesterase [Steroidobacteraceae bacterium]